MNHKFFQIITKENAVYIFGNSGLKLITDQEIINAYHLAKKEQKRWLNCKDGIENPMQHVYLKNFTLAVKFIERRLS